MYCLFNKIKVSFPHTLIWIKWKTLWLQKLIKTKLQFDCKQEKKFVTFFVRNSILVAISSLFSFQATHSILWSVGRLLFFALTNDFIDKNISTFFFKKTFCLFCFCLVCVVESVSMLAVTYGQLMLIELSSDSFCWPILGRVLVCLISPAYSTASSYTRHWPVGMNRVGKVTLHTHTHARVTLKCTSTNFLSACISTNMNRFTTSRLRGEWMKGRKGKKKKDQVTLLLIISYFFLLLLCLNSFSTHSYRCHHQFPSSWLSSAWLPDGLFSSHLVRFGWQSTLPSGTRGIRTVWSPFISENYRVKKKGNGGLLPNTRANVNCWDCRLISSCLDYIQQHLRPSTGLITIYLTNLIVCRTWISCQHRADGPVDSISCPQLINHTIIELSFLLNQFGLFDVISA